MVGTDSSGSLECREMQINLREIRVRWTCSECGASVFLDLVNSIKTALDAGWRGCGKCGEDNSLFPHAVNGIKVGK